MSFFKRFGGALKRFGIEIWRSCWDLEFYRTVRVESWTRGLRYLLAFGAVAAVLAAVAFLPPLVMAYGKARSYLASNLPAGTELAVKQGQFSTNLSAPYNLGDANLPFVVDSGVTGLDFPESLRADAGVLVGRDAIFLKESASERRVVALKEFPEFSVTKETALRWVDAYGPWFTAGIALFGLVGGYVGSLIALAAFILLNGALAWLFGRLWRLNLRYDQWVAVASRAVTLPIIVDAGFGAFRLEVPYAFSFIFFMFVVAVIADERQRPTAAPVSAPPVAKGD